MLQPSLLLRLTVKSFSNYSEKYQIRLCSVTKECVCVCALLVVQRGRQAACCRRVGAVLQRRLHGINRGIICLRGAGRPRWGVGGRREIMRNKRQLRHQWHRMAGYVEVWKKGTCAHEKWTFVCSRLQNRQAKQVRKRAHGSGLLEAWAATCAISVRWCRQEHLHHTCLCNTRRPKYRGGGGGAPASRGVASGERLQPCRQWRVHSAPRVAEG